MAGYADNWEQDLVDFMNQRVVLDIKHPNCACTFKIRIPIPTNVGPKRISRTKRKKAKLAAKRKGKK